MKKIIVGLFVCLTVTCMASHSKGTIERDVYGEKERKQMRVALLQALGESGNDRKKPGRSENRRGMATQQKHVSGQFRVR